MMMMMDPMDNPFPGVETISKPMRKLLVCCVCQVGYVQELENPVILPCLHTICFKCLDWRKTKADQGDRIKCPVCVASCPIPPGGVNAFPRDTFHRVLRKTLTRPSEEIPLGPLPLCKLHPEEEMAQYCDTCIVSVCRKCWEHHHEKHDVKSIKEVANSLEFELRNTVSIQLDKCISEASDNLDSLRANGDKMAADLQQARMRVKEEARRLREQIASREAAHLSQINSTELEMTPLLHKAQETYQSFLVSLRALKVYSDTLRAKGTDFDKACHAPGIMEQLEKERNVQFESFTWDSVMTSSMDEDDEEELPERKHILGDLDIKVTVRAPMKGPDGVVFGAPFRNNPILTECQNQVNIHQVHFPDFAPLFDRLCMIHIHHDDDHLERVCIHDESGKVCKQLSLPGVKGYGRSTVLDASKGRIMVSDFGSNRWGSSEHMKGAFHWLTLSPDLELIGHSVTGLECLPCMCSVGPTGEVLLTTRCPYEEHPARLIDMDSSGGLVRTVTLSYHDFRCPLSAARTDSGYVISDTVYDHVAWINHEGTILRTFSQISMKPFIFALHPAGVVLVPDWGGHKVHLIGEEGRLHRVLLTEDDGLNFPRRVFLDHGAGLLYVAQSETGITWRVKVFQFSLRAQPIISRHVKMELHL